MLVFIIVAKGLLNIDGGAKTLVPLKSRSNWNEINISKIIKSNCFRNTGSTSFICISKLFNFVSKDVQDGYRYWCNQVSQLQISQKLSFGRSCRCSWFIIKKFILCLEVTLCLGNTKQQFFCFYPFYFSFVNHFSKPLSMSFNENKSHDKLHITSLFLKLSG